MTAAADRHLLFGLLALQNGLIDQGALVAAFQAWTRDKSKTLADHLEARGDLTGPKRAALEAFAAVHIETHGGDVQQSLAVVPANRSTRASLVDLGEPEIEATLARVARSKNGHATEADDDNDPDRTAGRSLGTATSDGQRFRLLRPHARGGLGEVFVALDAELHREVALKQILEKHADDPFSRQRFVAEAEITGGLEHPGIVPVYGLGTYGGGRPYYAMRFIKGDSLKQAIEHFHGDHTLKNDPSRRSLELRKLLRRFLDVCNAVDYAHSRGVIHRDIKPANIILGRHGETLVVDWGLAKAVGRVDPSAGEQTIAPSSSGSSETLPGSALGTPAYMSPEQAGGELDRLGPRSDVYSLGATLYCLLTGRPPFDGDDVGETLRKVQLGEFAAPRELNPTLDWALEAICTKAMATKPADRYATCRALAEDLERWAADEPVTAYPEPWTRSLVRWFTRHRTGVTGVAAAVLAGMVGLSAVLAVQTQANAQLSASLKRETKAKLDLASANARLSDEHAKVEARNKELAAEQSKVQARFDMAVEAIETLHTGVSEDALLKNAEFTELRTKLLTEAARFYEDLEKLLVGQTDTKSRKTLAAGYFQLGQLMEKIGSRTEALAVHRKGLAMRRELAAEPRADVETRLDVARGLRVVARQLYHTGDVEGALRHFREMRDIAAALEAESPTMAVRQQLAQSYHSLGVGLDTMGKTEEGREAMRQAVAIRQKLVEDNPVKPEFQYELAETHSELGFTLLGKGERAEQLDSFRKALAIRQKLVNDNPANTDFQHSLARSHHEIGRALFVIGKPTEGLKAQRKALAIYQKLVDSNGAVHWFQEGLAGSHNGVGWMLLWTGKPEEALESCRKALPLQQKIVDANPTEINFQINLAGIYANLGMALDRQERQAEALAALDTSADILQKLAKVDPKNSDNCRQLADVYTLHGGAVTRAGKPAEAAADLRRALELWAKHPSPSTETQFGLVRARALLAGLGGDAKSGVTKEEAKTFAEQSVADLAALVKIGWAYPSELREPDFDALRGRADFQKLVAEVEAKAEKP